LSRARSVLREVWPRLAAIAILVAIWQLVYQSGFFDKVVLPSPLQVWRALGHDLGNGVIWRNTEASIVRLLIGFTVSVAAGTVFGLLEVASSFFERSFGSLVVGLQSLPSIAWLPLAVLWFGLSEQAVLFVVIVGSFPAVALATMNSVRQVPPLLQRAGRTMGASGWRLYRHVVLPAAIPGYVGGMQQGWAFAWRSLMAGELIIASANGLGGLLTRSQQNLETPTVIAVMAVIVIIGMFVDLAVFGTLDNRIRSRRGLLVPQG
jgi:NitT/TauT family transport system permease protein